jgi:two-component system LytT family sensor kinase
VIIGYGVVIAIVFSISGENRAISGWKSFAGAASVRIANDLEAAARRQRANFLVLEFAVPRAVVHQTPAAPSEEDCLPVQSSQNDGTWGMGRRFLLVSGVWCYFTLLLSVNNYVYNGIVGRPVTFRDALVYPIRNYAIWTLLTPLVLVFTARIRRAGKPTVVWILAHSFFSIFILALNALVWTPFAGGQDFAGIPRASWRFFQLVFWQSAEWNLWVYWAIVGIEYGIEYYFNVRVAQIRAAELESQLARSELQVLKNQLQPHFLFNALNSISSFMHTNVGVADDMISDLGALLRLSLESHATQEVPLAEELNSLQLYINIQRVRFQDRLSVQLNIDPESVEAYVPHLILQPLVENAFRHGISKRVGPGLVRIDSEHRNGKLLLRIADNGPGSPGDASNAEGIGLKNTYARLQRLYGQRAGMKIRNTSAGFEVELELPFGSDNINGTYGVEPGGGDRDHSERSGLEGASGEVDLA